LTSSKNSSEAKTQHEKINYEKTQTSELQRKCNKRSQTICRETGKGLFSYSFENPKYSSNRTTGSKVIILTM
jgi:hypothetical protein